MIIPISFAAVLFFAAIWALVKAVADAAREEGYKAGYRRASYDAAKLQTDMNHYERRAF
jgi:hypothetical protein